MKLYDLLVEMSADNDTLEFLPPETNIHWPGNYWELEAQAAKLTEEEAVVITAGEQAEMQELVDRKSLQELHQFLKDVFDGPLSKQFYPEL